MPLTCDQFFVENPPPKELENDRTQIDEFCEQHLKSGTPIVLITSGGTIVPLEHHTVRFVDNFSAGTRGSASAEKFLDAGYAVIFLYRLKSIEPFLRHVMGSKFLDILEIVGSSKDESSISVKSSEVPNLLPVLKKYKEAQESKRFLKVAFTTLSDYLWKLRTICEYLPAFGPRAMLYLAAAVSDFYVPAPQMPTHKMQSQDGAPVLHLDLVPKFLQPLVNSWVPNALVVSFKLETDEAILINKARGALNKYKHKIVLGNILDTRRYQVVAVTPDSETDIRLSVEQQKQGIEIEELIVAYLTSEHTKFMSAS